jgi:hypothetical protein
MSKKWCFFPLFISLLAKGCGKTTVLSHFAKAKAFAWWRKPPPSGVG